MQTFNASSATGYTARRETFRDKTHIVVPVTILTEGVHAGSNGPVYYPIEELSKHVSAWDGVPVTLGHPQTEDGFVSANSPKVLEDWALGQLFNTKWNDTKKALQSEIWVEEAAVQNKAPDLLKRIENGDNIEVSTGLFFDADENTGVWNGEDYSSTAKHYRPNHLAILPDSRGACSCADGCGIRANQAKEGKMDILAKIKELIWPTLTANEGSLEEYSKKLSELVSGMNKTPGNGMASAPGEKWAYVEATYPDEGYVVICQHGPEGIKYFLVDYEEDEDGMPSKLADTMTEAIRKVEYEPIEVPVAPIPVGNRSCDKAKNEGAMDDEDEDMNPKVKAAKKAREAMRKLAGNA